MDKNSPNSKRGKENHSFKRSPLTETKILTSEAASNIVHLEKTNEAMDSSKLNVIFIGNENSELVKKILNFDTSDSNSQQLKMSKQPLILKNLPGNMFFKGVHTHKENVSGSYSRLSQVESMLSTISKRIMYSVSDMSYHVLMKKVHTDFLYFQEVCRIGTIKNDSCALHHEITSFCSSGLKKENASFEELNPSNAHSNVEEAIKTVYSNIKDENVNAVNIMSLKFSENSSKYSLQGLGNNNKNGISEKSNSHFIVMNEASTVSNQVSTMILDNKNSNVDNSYLKSMGNYSKYSLEYPEKKKNKLSEEVDKSSNISAVIKDASYANNRHFRINTDKESSNIRGFEFGKNNSKYLQHSVEGKKYGASQESAASDSYSVVTITVSNVTKPDMALGLDYENSKIVDEKDSSKSLNSSNQQTEPLDLTVKKFQNDFNSAELKSISKSLSTSQEVLSFNSSTTGKNPSKISVDKLIENIIFDSLGVGKKTQVTRIAAKESKASILETEIKSKKDLQREPMNDLNKSSVELSDSVYIPSVLTNGNNSGSTISRENKYSNITEKESVSSDILTTTPNINDTVSKTTFKADKIKSSEKTLPDPKTCTSSHNIAPAIDSSLFPKDLARELCFDFLHFTTKWNAYRKDLENKLTKSQLEMETLIKNTAKICSQIEDVSASTLQGTKEVKKSFSQLQYLILTATSKLTPFFRKASGMQKDFQSLHNSMEQYNNGVEIRIARIFNVLCEKNESCKFV